MPTLYLLDNPGNPRRRGGKRRHNPWYDNKSRHAAAARKGWRHHKGRYHRNPDGTFSGSTALANPKRRGTRRHRNPTFEKFFAGFGIEDIALAAVAMVGVQKLEEMLPSNWRSGFMDPVAAAGVTGGLVMLLKSEPKLARAVGMGGGIASVLKVGAQIPALGEFVQPGSLVIGSHRPRIMVNPAGAALPSGKTVPMSTPVSSDARVRM